MCRCFSSSKKLEDKYKIFSYEHLNQKLSYKYKPKLENKEIIPLSNYYIDPNTVNDNKNSLETKEIKTIDTTTVPDRTKFIRAHNYMAQVEPNGEFICISSRNRKVISEEKQDTITKQLCENKFKVHISLPEGQGKVQQNQLALGWNIIKTILIDNNVDSFKIARQNIIMALAPGQSGKIITIYCDGNPEKTLADWKRIFEQIGKALITVHIQPGDPITGTLEKPEKAIKGSHGFLYYRYNEENPWPINDPCDNITLTIPNPATGRDNAIINISPAINRM